MTDESGIGHSACTIIIAKRKIKIGKLKHAYRLFVSAIKFEDESIQSTKHFWVMAIDNDGYVNCVYNVLNGLPNFETGIILIDIFRVAITRGCERVIIAHNRPEGKSLDLDQRRAKNNKQTLSLRQTHECQSC